MDCLEIDCPSEDIFILVSNECRLFRTDDLSYINEMVMNLKKHNILT